MTDENRQLAQAWFRKAEHDLLSARNNLVAEEIPTDAVCFHCQQAAEKYLKGLLAWHGVPVERTHDLVRLWALSVEVVTGLEAPEAVILLLNDFSVAVRYPDPDELDPTLEQAQEALTAAMAIRDAVRLALGISHR
jgi:HEPN domain-containing protein